MEKFLVLLFITGLLSSGSESFKITDKEYENIDRILQIGVQVFLNCLDKVKEATEKLVKDDMLRTNRIAIQDHWNAFRDTANRISVEERGKGEMDDLIVAARIFQRLVGHYKDDAKKIFHTVIVEQNVRLYLPPINTFKGTIERSKVNEVWGNLVKNYFPDAPPIENQPLDFLCYLLSTSAAESFIVNVMKFGMEAISQYKKIDFGTDSNRVTSRLIVFYWDGYLNSADTPELKKQYDAISDHFEFFKEFYLIGLSPVVTLHFADPKRFDRTAREIYNEKWKPFIEELNKLVNEERNELRCPFPQVRAVGRMAIAKFGAFVDRVNAEINDDTVMILSKRWEKIKDSCITRLLDSGALTQEQLDEARSVLEEDVMALYNKYLEFMEITDPKRVDETFK
ncbi:hypothetical protein NFI96_016949 [Prochilodus magdalenae]|nr:hypothetical protein NFI96_016949 [Prochilodus magdalenae]